jgi:predicted RNase H-like nuclease (RuvC/YqgF family)
MVKIDFIKTFPNEKVYTEKEWNDMENYYMALLDKEREQKNRAQQHVINLTESIKKKRAEIEQLEYFITSLTLSLKLSSDYVVKLRSQLQKID